MKYDAELTFLKRILKNYNLSVYTFDQNSEIDCTIDLGIRKVLGCIDEYSKTREYIFQYIQPNTVYFVSDIFLCHYILLQLPDYDTPTYMLIGPYTELDYTESSLFERFEKHKIPPALVKTLLNFFGNVTRISNPTVLNSLMHAFAEVLWGDSDHYSFSNINQTDFEAPNYTSHHPIKEVDDLDFRMRMLESRYAAENRFFQNVSKGYLHKAETSFSTGTLLDIEPRIDDSLRNFKNYCIIMNTLLRKAVEAGGVHPIYIDQLSTNYAKKIEMLHSPVAGRSLMQEMIRKYCLLVKNHSLKGYSLLVQKVIVRIDTDLTADLSLRAHAQYLNINPSYLSTLFKKETGQTLTEYVNQKRVQHGLFLLNSTNMQIQTVAQHCGISDINYFTRIFKKQVGQTPSEYKNSINSN